MTLIKVCSIKISDVSQVWLVIAKTLEQLFNSLEKIEIFKLLRDKTKYTIELWFKQFSKTFDKFIKTCKMYIVYIGRIIVQTDRLVNVVNAIISVKCNVKSIK